MTLPKWFKPFVFSIILLSGAAPIVFYLWIFGMTPALNAESALTMLNDPAQNAILVDVRAAGESNGLYRWSVGEIYAAKDIPADLKGKTLILICNSGIQSALAARRLRSMGVTDVYYARGGIQKWVEAEARPPFQFESQYKTTPLVQQVSAVVAGFVFKPIHMILSAALAFVLLKQKSSGLKTLGWGFAIFLASETSCAINYLFFNHDSYLFEYLHNYGMTLSFGFIAFAFMDGLDERLIQFSARDKRCALLPLCRECYKHNETVCKIRMLIPLFTGMIAALAFMPLLAKPLTANYTTDILGSPYHYCRLLLSQYFESRYVPIVALIFCAGTFVSLRSDRSNPIPPAARVLISGAIGALGFSLFRLMLGAVYSEALIWSDFWEEATELMLVAAVAAIVWTYRKALISSALPKT